MAVIDALPGIDVRIVLKGKHVAQVEYANEDDKDSYNALYSTSKYIEAKDNAAFGVECSFTQDPQLVARIRSNEIVMAVSFGNDNIVYSIITNPFTSPEPLRINYARSFEGGVCYEQNLIFAKLDICESVLSFV